MMISCWADTLNRPIWYLSGNTVLAAYWIVPLPRAEYLKSTFYQSAFLTKMLLQPDGKILLTGKTDFLSGQGRALLARLTAQGSLDSSFAGTGFTAIPTTALTETGRTIALRSDGKILLASASTSLNAPAGLKIVQFNKDGSSDPNFGTGGSIYKSSNLSDLLANDLLVQPDGKIVVLYENANNLYYSGNTNFGLGMLRFLANGQTDSSFGIQGQANNAFVDLSLTAPFQMLRQNDGRILVTGIGNQSTYIPRILVARVNTNGVFDTTLAPFIFNTWNAELSYTTPTGFTIYCPSTITRLDSVSYLVGGNIKLEGADGWLTKLVIKDSFPAKNIVLADTLPNGNCSSVQLFWSTTNETGSKEFCGRKKRRQHCFFFHCQHTRQSQHQHPNAIQLHRQRPAAGKKFLQDKPAEHRRLGVIVQHYCTHLGYNLTRHHPAYFVKLYQ